MLTKEPWKYSYKQLHVAEAANVSLIKPLRYHYNINSKPFALLQLLPKQVVVIQTVHTYNIALGLHNYQYVVYLPGTPSITVSNCFINISSIALLLANTASSSIQQNTYANFNTYHFIHQLPLYLPMYRHSY